MKIAFLVRDLCHMGGVVSATQNLAGALAARHEVEIVALRKVRDASYFALDSRVTVRSLTDLRPHSPAYDGDDPLAHEFPLRYPYPEGEKKPVVSRLAEKRLLAYLAGTDADVVVSSNPRITTLLATASGRYLKVAQEHSMPGIYPASVRKILFGESYPRLDAITVLTPEERTSLSGLVPDVQGRIHVMPNCIPDPGGRLSEGSSKVVVAAGVFKPHKNFDGLIDAFATVAARHPDWRLRIYGSGPEESALRRRIQERGLYNHVHLMGPAFPVTAEFAKGSVFVLPSLREPFGNVTVEAMTRRLPVVALDCDHGPRNILTHGEDGLLVPPGDTEALAQAVIDLIEDDDRRRAMAEKARRTSERYGPGPSADRFEAILTLAAAARELPGAADCTVLAGGDLQVRLRPRQQAGAVPDGLSLLCRDVQGRNDAVTLSFVGGTAIVPRRGTLAEGTWELVVVSDQGPEKVLRTGHCDAGHLVAPDWEPGPEGLHVLLPHAEEDGRLRVRSRVRAEHAEVTRLEVGEDSVLVECRFWGAGTVAAGDVVTAVNRGDRGRELSFPVVRAEGTRFRFETPLDTLVAEHAGEEQIWDVWVRPGTAGRARVGMLLTDILHPYKVFRYPRPVRRRPVVRTAGAGRPQGRRFLRAARGDLAVAVREQTGVEIRPYYTTAAQLAFKTVAV